MSRNCYSEINLHITWHTKLNRPMLTTAVEALAHQVLKRKLVDWPGVFAHAIGGTSNHVHLAVTIPPTITISEFVGQPKGYSAHEVNRQLGMARKDLQWQEGYGVVSFGTRVLPWVIAYVNNQKEHHARNTIYPRLESIASSGKPRERG